MFLQDYKSILDSDCPGSMFAIWLRSAFLIAAALLVLNHFGLQCVHADETESSASENDPSEAPQRSVKLSFPARELPAFEFPECMGESLSLDDMAGKRWVASFVFTRCVTTCPAITLEMKKLHDRVAESAPDVKFVTFTVDPNYDTEEILKTYSEAFSPDRERWKFVTGDQEKLYSLIVGGFGLYVSENLGEARLPGYEVAHSNRVVLVNEDGFPVGTFLATRPADMSKLRRILAGQDDFPEPGPALQFSTSDGSIMPIQLEVTPAESSEGATNENDQSSDSVSGGQVLNEGSDEIDPLNAVEHNRQIDEKLPDWVRRLPSTNAMLNSAATVLLLMGWFAIKNQQRKQHRNIMISAFVMSVVFLGCYLVYHYQLGQYTGEHGRKFTGTGAAAIGYQVILWPHIVLAVFVPFLAIRVFMHAFAERWDAHRKLAKITFPIWLFVSVTGVIIYGMLYHWPN